MKSSIVVLTIPCTVLKTVEALKIHALSTHEATNIGSWKGSLETFPPTVVLVPP